MDTSKRRFLRGLNDWAMEMNPNKELAPRFYLYEIYHSYRHCKQVASSSQN